MRYTVYMSTRNIHQSIEHLQQVLWETDVASVSRARAMSLVGARILYRVIEDFLQGQLTLRAMSLVYTTLLSLVPLLALSFSLLKAFGVHNQLEPMLLNFLEPFGEKGVETAAQIVGFVQNIGVGVLGTVGLVLLIYTVVSLLQKVEEAFNFIWHVSSLRNLPQRLSGYLSVVMVGPMLVVTALGITASVMSSALVSQLVAIEPFGTLFYALSKLVPYLLVIGAFTATYMIIPNTTVHWRSALIGGIVSGVLWETVGWGFASFIVGSAKYTAIYSGFAIVILFLVWLYLNWLVLLLGSSIAFYHQNPGYQSRSGGHVRLSLRRQQILALEVMRMLGEAYQSGENRITATTIAEEFLLPMEAVDDVLSKLQVHGLVVQSCDESPHLLPGRDLRTIFVKDVFDVVSGELDTPPEQGVRASQAVMDVVHQFDELSMEHFAKINIMDILAQTESLTSKVSAQKE
jgi:membrane protein